MIIRATLSTLARVLGCGEHQAETVVREERSARAALSRRGFFQAVGAVAAGTLVSVPEPDVYIWTSIDIGEAARQAVHEMVAKHWVTMDGESVTVRVNEADPRKLDVTIKFRPIGCIVIPEAL